MDTAKKFFLALFPQTGDTFSPRDPIEISSSGTLRATANTLSRSSIITTGSPKLDLSPLHPRPQSEDSTSHQLDGTAILKSGTTKPSTLRTASKSTTEALMLSLFLLEETLL
jgi:hypothetical protein